MKLSHLVNSRAARKTCYRVALPLYWVALFSATHYPRLRVPEHVPYSDKWAHVTAFGLLAFLLWRFAETYRRPLPAWFAWAALPVLGLYAALDEHLQGYFGRNVDIRDWWANLLGIGLVLAGLEIHRRLLARRR